MDFREFVKIMEALRRECPWDRKQTRESLKPYIIEEAYELVEAIDEGDPEKVREELGDLLLQIVFQSRIAQERGEFGMDDVIDSIGSKMVSRHPHVFDKARFATAEEVARQWEERKKEEGKLRESILEGVPEAMPSLLRAHRLQSRASRAGFDWQKVDDVMEKLDEELSEFREVLEQKDQGRIEDELGDIFFALVNISRFVGVNPEDALRKTISKFISRFRYIETVAAGAGLSLSEMSLAEMDRLWEEAKGRE